LRSDKNNMSSKKPKPLLANVKQTYKEIPSYDLLGNKIDAPSVQRSIDRRHVKQIFNYIVTSHTIGETVILGTIELVDLDGKWYCVDGQHRLCALKDAYAQHHKIPFFVHIYSVRTQDQMNEIFYIRNRNVPIPDFLLSDTIDCDRKKLLERIEEDLKNNKSTLFRETKAERRPYIRISDFMDKIQELNNLDTFEDYEKIFDRNNKRIKRENSEDSIKKKKLISPAMWKLCEEHNIWFGLDKK
jgi:Protein of unknown function DUF262